MSGSCRERPVPTASARRPAETAPTDAERTEPRDDRFVYGRPHSDDFRGATHMSWIIVLVLLILLIGAIPSWPHSAGWGYYPSGGLGIVLIIVIILLLMGRI